MKCRGREVEPPGVDPRVLVPALLLGCSPPAAPPGRAPPPALADPSRLRLVAIGDTGRGDAGQRAVADGVARVCRQRGCDLIALLGDNLYERGMERPDDPRMAERTVDMYAAAGAPLYAVLGNHDYGLGQDHEAAGWQIAWARRTPGIELPARTWSMRAGPAELFALDTNAAMWSGSATQARWLRRALEQSDAAWRVVLGHHAFRSNGDHGNAGQYEGLFGVPIASGTSLWTLFEKTLCGRADLYLSGHDHNLQALSHCGVELVVSGAGANARAVVDRGNTPRFAAAHTGFAWLELGTAELTLAFHDADGNTVYEHTLPHR